jgi:hypothetical protein
MNIRWRWQVAVAGAVVVAACGGGGGSDTSLGGGGVGSGGGVTSLVPAAPAVGAVLYASATTLRPLRNGATWNYRGTRTAYTGAAPLAYLTATSHPAASAGGATETTTNSGNDGPDVQTIVVSGGVVGMPQSVDYAGKGVAQAFDVIELRSPVRQDDQYTILDKRYTDTAIDADGDGKPDTLDVAIYARVAGNETLALPNLPPIKALRIDTFVLARVIASSTGQVSPTAQSSLRTWYAEGIGIVRQASVQPTESGTDVTTIDEQLSSWDGVTSGFGVMAQVPATIPAGSSTFPGSVLPSGGFRFAAFAFNDHALVFTDPPGTPSGTLISRLDFRGAIQSATLVSNLSFGRCAVLAANAAGVICLEGAASGSSVDYDVSRVDSNGNVVGAVRGASINLAGGRTSPRVDRLVGAIDGATLWLFWARSYYDLGTGQAAGELILRPYALDGVALAPEIVVGPNGSQLSLTAGAGRVTISWLRWTAPTTEPTLSDWNVATASTAGVSATRVLATNLDSTNVFVTQLRAGDLDAIAWPQVPGTRVEGVGGLVFDTPLSPRRAGTTLSDERIAGVPAYNGAVPSMEAFGSRLAFTTLQQATLWPGDTVTSAAYDASWLDIGAGPLATTSVSKVRWGAVRANGQRDGQLLLSDRLLVFEPRLNNFGLGTTVVWLNRGPPA